MTDIAIIGLGCRFPGAPDIHGYWKLLMSGERQFSAVPRERWNHETFYEPGNRSAPNAAYTDQVAFLDGVDRFDALHYGVPPARARAMDPQHRLMLDVTREALDDAGLGRGDFDRENTGAFFGISVSDYKDLMTTPIRALTMAEESRAPDGHDGLDALKEQAGQLGAIQSFTLPGSLLNMAAGTVSRHFDLGGPSFAVDAACSGSLVALDQAMAHLRQGTCRTALVGGVYLNLTPDSLVGFSRLRALSAAGVCRPFDEGADGFVLGEGAGVVVIRPLADALADGDRVYAVIKGIGSANDGASPGPLVPTAEGQLRAMRRAYDDAGVAPSSVGFLEAHGTGTAAGDRAEAEALRRLRTEYPDDDPGLCYVGAGKALIGHSLAAAGIAGLIKTALVVHHRTIVPQPETTPHPDLGISDAGLRFAATARPFLDTGTPRRAAVSSFGFGGTNVHVVLEEQQPAPAPGRLPERAEDTGPLLVLLSAGNAELLDQHIGEVLDALDTADCAPLAAVAHTLGARVPLTARLAIVATDTDAFLERLRHAREQLLAGARGDLGDGAYAADAPLPAAQRRIAFLFPGQGSQRPGMMRDFYERFPAFRSAVGVLSAVARGDVGFDLGDLLYGEAATSRGDAEELRQRLAATDVCQPLLGTVQIAATRVLADCGVAPDLALGHSLGEFAAAAAAGALTNVDTVRLLVHRGAALRQAESGFRGGMLAVQSDEETCRRLMDGIDDVWLACFNQPRQVVVSGTLEGLAALRQACAEDGVVTAALEVSNAFHSPRLACAEEAVRSGLATRRISSPVLPFVSSVNAEVCTDPDRLRELWTRHASTPVHFSDAVRTAYDQGARIFLQVTGGNSLLTSVRRNLTGHGDVHVVPACGEAPDGGRAFALALARLAVLGAPVDPRALVPQEDRRLLDLPVARLDTQSYWVSGKRPSKKDTSAPAQPISPEETSMNAPTNDPMNELLQLVQQQATLITRLTEALPAPNPPAQTTPPSTAGTAPVPASPAIALPTAPVVPDVPAAAADSSSSRAPADEEPPTGGIDAVTDAVLEHVARISAFPVSHLRGDQLLIDELGFDSLMLTDLFTSLKRQWPSWEFDEKVADRPTVGSVAALIASSTGDAVPAAVPGQRAEPVDAAHAEETASPSVDAPADPLPAAPPSADPRPDCPASAAPAPSALPEEHTRIECFPEVTAHGERIASLAGMGLANPYFLVHEGGMTDTTVVDGRELLSFSSYNYLGMATHRTVNEAAKEAIERFGTSVSASRLLSGSRPLHLELDTELAGLLGCEAAITLANGHATNVTVIGHLVGPGDLVIHDSLAHDSILQGCKLSGATRRPFPHNDAAALDAILTQVRHQYRRVLVVIEGVYSMDGDIADLPALVEVKQRHGALLMIDEAHSIGTIGETGRGIGEYHGIERPAVDLWSGTLSKALASCGGYVAGSRSVIEYLRYTVPGFVFSAGMTPADTAASLTALRVLRREPERVTRLAENAALFVRLARGAGIDIGDSHDTAIVPCIVGDSLKTLRLAEALFQQGISVNPILYPAVPEEMARLRFFITCDHTPEQIRRTVTVLEQELRHLDPAPAAAAA
ncbi:aminotransferase class I/II-fold pyridoxal phosphate-dependent enzyme [Streptomyces sp. ISL-43]|uniref:type I polyketide synthase n=1 Tax=Streptomyces sp. ISL-43 TaxID=2819183 RepID=UPI001BE51468|nr:type I polyketide synthase [Streptomyces sp. ISL-43]MBT2449796.1 aminotransferase class I/II-fold pyridoxal phosphate-dependent enzyme [Streptomyces sp. ISL-43]